MEENIISMISYLLFIEKSLLPISNILIISDYLMNLKRERSHVISPFAHFPGLLAIPFLKVCPPK